MKKIKKEYGITLVALVITIIILLILVGISISSITGKDGLLSKAQVAKIQTDVANEKEGIGLAVTATRISDNGYGNIEKDSLQEALDGQFGKEKTTVEDNGDKTYTVTINNSDKRKYTVEEDGTITEGQYDKWNGTEATEPAEKTENEIHIYTVAELKWLADQVNNEGNLFEGYTIYLENNLDLGAREENGNWETEANEALKWTAIGKEKTKTLQAEFDGKNHIIKGVYVNDTTNFNGIFGNSSTILNLTVKNSYVKGASGTAGIVGALRSGKIDNCHNVNTTVIGTPGFSFGGIVGQADGDIINCSNTGKIVGSKNPNSDYGQTGGIVGRAYNNVINCYNVGSISGEGICVGGIVGLASISSQITNCYNTGTITGDGNWVGGIAGSAANIITKSYNTGKVKGKENIGGIVGACVTKIPQNISLCYNTGTVEGVKAVGGISGYLGAQGYAGTETKCYNKGKIIYTGTEENYGEIVGHMANDATVTKCYYLANNDNNYGVGTINPDGNIEEQRKGAQKTDVDLKTFEEFMNWIEQQ